MELSRCPTHKGLIYQGLLSLAHSRHDSESSKDDYYYFYDIIVLTTVESLAWFFGIFIPLLLEASRKPMKHIIKFKR